MILLTILVSVITLLIVFYDEGNEIGIKNILGLENEIKTNLGISSYKYNTICDVKFKCFILDFVFRGVCLVYCWLYISEWPETNLLIGVYRKKEIKYAFLRWSLKDISSKDFDVTIVNHLFGSTDRDAILWILFECFLILSRRYEEIFFKWVCSFGFFRGFTINGSNKLPISTTLVFFSIKACISVA